MRTDSIFAVVIAFSMSMPGVPSSAAADVPGTGEVTKCDDKTLAGFFGGPLSHEVPVVTSDAGQGLITTCLGGIYAWKAFVALNWPAESDKRDEPDIVKTLGDQSNATVWESFRSKVEVYPGNGTAKIGPHGYDQGPHKNYGYNDAPEYIYDKASVGGTDGTIPSCDDTSGTGTTAYVNLDETTQIGNNQTFAGLLPKEDPTHKNSSPQLIRYSAKMNKEIYLNIVKNRFWYNEPDAPLDQARKRYTDQLAKDRNSNPEGAIVNLIPSNIRPDETADGQANNADNRTSFEVKSAWRPLSDAETASGRFHTARVRYYEKRPSTGKACYREAVWGLVGMHLISFTKKAPWVIWSTFEQVDNILDAKGQPTEKADGGLIKPIPYGASPTSPVLSSDPSQVHPVVTATGEACTEPGSRLFFRENPHYMTPKPDEKPTLPSGIDICVNARWHQVPDEIQNINRFAQKQISQSNALGPWQFYKLINVQPEPVDFDDRDTGDISTESSYYLANATIETDLSLGRFTGDLVAGVPSNVKSGTTSDADAASGIYIYHNTRLLPFQSLKIGSLIHDMRMGGCSGCHAFATTQGTDFSFALFGQNGKSPSVQEPELPDAFGSENGLKARFRNYKQN